jgi:hypothetical protein
MTHRIGRRMLGASALTLFASMAVRMSGARAVAPDEIVVDWATYNPVSLCRRAVSPGCRRACSTRVTGAACCPTG